MSLPYSENGEIDVQVVFTGGRPLPTVGQACYFAIGEIAEFGGGDLAISVVVCTLVGQCIDDTSRKNPVLDSLGFKCEFLSARRTDDDRSSRSTQIHKGVLQKRVGDARRCF